MEEYLIFIGVALVIILSPGPDFILVLNNALSQGMSKGYATFYGIVVGQFLHVGALVLGVSLIIAKSQALFEVIKWLGAGYLIYLGIRSLLAKQPADYEVVTTRKLKGDRQCFAEGLMSTVFNPKVLLFYLTFVPQFIHTGDRVMLKSLLLGSLFIVLVCIWYTVFLQLIYRVQHWFKRGRSQLLLNRIAGVALVGIGASLLGRAGFLRQ